MARSSRGVRRLLAQAEEQPYGFARTAIVEQAVREADLDGDLDLSFESRVALASAAEHGGEPQKALVAVTWCLGQIDAHPGRFEVHSTYWALKWLPFSLLDVPDVPLEEVDRVVQELERRYRAEGTGEDAVANLRWGVSLATGHVEQAVQGHREWRLLPRSEYADCRACDVSGEVSLALATGEPRRALEVARPVLAGRLECGEEPHRVLSKLLAPLAELGEHEEAERLHQWGLRLSRGNPALATAQARHLSHLVRTSRLDDAADLLVELLQVVDRGMFDVDGRMRVQAVGASLAASLAEAGVERFPGAVGARPQETAVLAQELSEAARGTADAFDRRNGNDAARAEVDALLAVRPVRPAPDGAPDGRPAPTSSEPSVVPAVASPPPPAPVAETTDPAELLRRAREDDLDDAAALALCERAVAGFEAAQDAGGLARARRSRGAALVRLGREDEGRVLLEQAFDELAGQPDERLNAALLLARNAFDPDDPGSVARAEHWRQQAEREAPHVERPEQAQRDCRLMAVDWAVMLAEPDGVDAAAAAYAQVRDELGDDREGLVEVWADEALARAVAGDHEGGLRACDAGWELAVAAQDDAALAAIGELRASLLAACGRHDDGVEALRLVQEAEQRLGRSGAAAESAQARADLLLELDRPQDALRAAYEAVDLLAGSGDRSGPAWARVTVGRAFRELGSDQSAYDAWSEVVGQAADDGDRRLEAAVSLDLARLDLEYDHLDEALDGAKRAQAAAAGGEPEDVARVLRLLAVVHHAREELPAALAAGEQCLQVLEGVDDDPLGLLPSAQASHADLLVLADRPEQALALYDAARARFEAEDDPLAVAGVDLSRVDALHALGRAAEAVALAEQVVATGRAEDEPVLVADALWAVASYTAPDASRYDAAIEAYAQAGAPDEQLADLRARRDDALRPRRSRWRR